MSGKAATGQTPLEAGWGFDTAGFRVAFHQRPQPRATQTLDDIRWALAAADPATPILCGALTASDGAKMPYRLWPSTSPRACVVLVHGAFDYAGAYDEIGPKFAARGIAAIAFDQRGFGATQSRGNWSGAKRMAQDLSEVVAYMKTRYAGLPVFVVGESMGAAVAVHAAADDLDAQGMVLVAPGAISGASRRFMTSLVVVLLNAFVPGSEITVERRSARELTPAAAIRLVCDPLVLRTIRLKLTFGLLELAASAVDQARKVRIPTLTMIGSKENLVNANCVARLHRSIHAEKYWRKFRGGPHLLLHWARSDEVFSAIFGWLDGKIPQEAPPRDEPATHSFEGFNAAPKSRVKSA